MLTQTLPRSAEAYRRAQQREIAAAVASVRALWRRMGPDFDPSFAALLPPLLAVLETAQGRIAEGALAYVPAVLEETGQTRAVESFATPRGSALVGVAGDGRPLDGLLYGAVTHAKQGVAGGLSAQQALTSGGRWLTMAAGTVLSDTGRHGESLAMGVRPVGGYVRMLVPPSCSRCAILAGAWYRSKQPFDRHPGCDCRHIPASEAVGNDLTVNVAEYFDSLTDAEQNRIFTNAGAEAIRNGADINQVVNARRGMRTAQIGGRDVLITTEGTTRRGMAYRHLSPSSATDVRAPISRFGAERATRYSSARRPRAMPETIQAIAKDREDYLRLLRANGYIL